MEIWQAILIAFGGNAALLAVLAFSGKSLISHWLTKSATEHQIKFTRFSEKQADAIAGTYSRARKFNARLKEYLEIPDFTAGGNRAERKREAAMSHREFLDYFQQNQIYLSKSSVGLINKITRNRSIFSTNIYIRLSPPMTRQEQRRSGSNLMMPYKLS
jgi:hypothetical protein